MGNTKKSCVAARVHPEPSPRKKKPPPHRSPATPEEKRTQEAGHSADRKCRAARGQRRNLDLRFRANPGPRPSLQLASRVGKKKLWGRRESGRFTAQEISMILFFTLKFIYGLNFFPCFSFGIFRKIRRRAPLPAFIFRRVHS